jgi:hypothetical protein
VVLIQSSFDTFSSNNTLHGRVCFERGRIDGNGFARNEFLVVCKFQYPLKDSFMNGVGQSLSDDRKGGVIRGMVGQFEAKEFSNRQTISTSPCDAPLGLDSFEVPNK